MSTVDTGAPASISTAEDAMEVDQPVSAPAIAPSPPSNNKNEVLAVIVRDNTDWLSNIQSLRETDVIILLTPVVIPISKDPTDTSDPFEPLGRSLAKRHARVRQVPYTQRNGITSTHLGFIKRGHVIILCFALRPGQPIQLEFADIAFAVSENKPVIIVVCCTPLEPDQSIPFPTLIQTKGYSPPALEATAALIFGEYESRVVPTQPIRQPTSITVYPPERTDGHQSKHWDVTEWNEARDIASVLDLWQRNISPRFAVDEEMLAALLRRPGYAKHYVIRDKGGSQELLGFCATYLSFVDQEGEKLIASIAVLLVQAKHRNQGIGSSLHTHALEQLRKPRGVIRLQLGSTFPRIFLGPPMDMPINEEWFRRRGWELGHTTTPGQGQNIYDLVLDFEKWRSVKGGLFPSSVTFRLCTQDDMDRVLELVETVSTMTGKMGWFDQYASLSKGPNVKDIVLGIERDKVIAAALTYTPSCGSQIATNLPWASRIGLDVGGVTCICIPPPNQAITLIGLLDSCVQNLKEQGIKRMFIDGVSNGFDDLKGLGFEEWARYKDVWKDI